MVSFWVMKKKTVEDMFRYLKLAGNMLRIIPYNQLCEGGIHCSINK